MRYIFMANPRLRKAFRYPTDGNNEPEAIDEEGKSTLSQRCIVDFLTRFIQSKNSL